MIATNGILSPDNTTACYNIILDALKFLSSLTNKVTEQAAWKYTNPAEIKNDTFSLTSIYEQSVQYNYSSEEKKVLLQYISMIKNLSRLLDSMIPRVQPTIDTFVFTQVQAFTKNQVTEYYNSALKKKKNTATLLKNVKDGLLDVDVESKTNASVPKDRSDPISNSQVLLNMLIVSFISLAQCLN